MAESGKPPPSGKSAGVSDRLTKNELTWLLTQEARSAAQKLRVGVGMTAEAIPPPPASEEGSGGVESTLNRLDEAVSMLASIHGHPTPRGRRGRIDLAALLWEIAPEARVQIEMGEGTTVFGDESELRRMLHVLLAQAGDPGRAESTAEVFIRRVGEDVRVAVNLGPDQPPTVETERAWLSRMSIRYGGRIELDGSMQTLVLPADVDTHRREVETLKRELAAAQAQGEAYARELAAVLRTDTDRAGPLRSPSAINLGAASHQAPSGDALAVLVAAVRSVGAEIRGILSAIGRDIAPLRDRPGDVGEIAASVARHVTAASEAVADMARVGACPVGELPRHTDVADVLRGVIKADAVRAARHDVTVELTAPEDAQEVVSVGALTVLLHVLLQHALVASPPGSKVEVTLAERDDALAITFDDAGPTFPESARAGLLSRDFEALAAGRPTGMGLIAAYTIAAHLRAPLEIEDGPHGGARVRLTVTRSVV